MDMAPILEAFRDNWLGDQVRAVPWLFSVFETVHFVGLCLLIGALLVVDLRVLGIVRGLSMKTALKLVPVAVVGFVLNLVSGIGFFTNDPELYWSNPAFRLKMLFVAIAGLNAAWFTFAEQRHLSVEHDGSAPAIAKLTATLSLGLWILVLILGRLLPIYSV